jgi:hypothetical protein
MRRMVFAVPTVLIAGALCFGTPAFAQSSAPVVATPSGGIDDTGPHHRPSMITVWGILPYAYGVGLGVGARYTLPLVHDGFVRSINNSVELEFGGDLGFFGLGGLGYTNLDLAAELRWTFHMTPVFDLYPKVGLGYRFFISGVDNAPVAAAFYEDIGGGLLYRIGSGTQLRAEIGYSGLRVGVGFEL